MKVARLTPLSSRMKSKVKEHGDVWEVVKHTVGRWHLVRTLNPVHGTHPYEVWVEKNKTVKIDYLDTANHVEKKL